MRFENEIQIHQPAAELFAFLTDVERVAPCLPGASIDGRDGDDYTGSMKVKVGPISGTYKGRMRFLEQDEERLSAVMSARAAEVNGQGDAEARITTHIEAAGEDASVVRMETDLQMRGRVAQFGRGAMEKISQRMFDEFARNLEREMAGRGAPAQPARGADGERDAHPGEGTTSSDRGEDDGQALDAMTLVVLPALKKALPVVAPVLVALGYGYLLGRLRELRR